MSYAKWLALVLGVSLAMVALASVGTAAATELCSANEAPCAETNMYKPGQEVRGVIAGKFIWTGTFAVECLKSTFKGQLENTGSAGETVAISGESLSFGECGACTVTVNKAPTQEVHTDGAVVDGNGAVTWKAFEISMTCSGISCKWGGNIEAAMTLAGGNTAILRISKASVPLIGGAGEFFCGKRGEWDAEYEITTPKPLFVV
jgi:hypothetical protein